MQSRDLTQISPVKDWKPSLGWHLSHVCLSSVSLSCLRTIVCLAGILQRHAKSFPSPSGGSSCDWRFSPHYQLPFMERTGPRDPINFKGKHQVPEQHPNGPWMPPILVSQVWPKGHTYLCMAHVGPSCRSLLVYLVVETSILLQVSRQGDLHSSVSYYIILE